MANVVKTTFRPAVPVGMRPDIKVGSKVPQSVVEQAIAEQEARVKLNISDPSGVRPFIDQPVIIGELPLDRTERAALVSKLVHEYRNANPNVIHAVGILAPDFVNTEDVAYLTNLYYKCQGAFNTMITQIKEQHILPITPRLESLMWENIAFPRLANNLHLLRACVIYFEQDNDALIVHVLFVLSQGESTVFSTRIAI